MPLSDNKGIWLFFSKKGNLISKVPNGNSIRQKGSFTLIFAFEDNDYMGQKSLAVSFQRPGDKSYMGSYPAGEPVKTQFKKYKVNEITYGLVDGKVYNTYNITFGPDSGITNKYGNLNVVAQIRHESDDSLVYYEGAVSLYIEPTFGKGEDTSFISKSEHETLTNLINDFSFAKLNKDRGEATNLTINNGLIKKDTLVEGEDGNTVIGSKDVQKSIDVSIEQATKDVVRENDIHEFVKAGDFGDFDSEEPALLYASYAEEANLADKAIHDNKGNVIDETYLKATNQGWFEVNSKNKSNPYYLPKSGMYLIKKGSYFGVPGNEYAYAEDDCFVLYTEQKNSDVYEQGVCSFIGHIYITQHEGSDQIGRKYTYLNFKTAFKYPLLTWQIIYNGFPKKVPQFEIMVNGSDLDGGDYSSSIPTMIFAPNKRGEEGQILTAGTTYSPDPKWITPPWLTREEVQQMINEAINGTSSDN